MPVYVGIEFNFCYTNTESGIPYRVALITLKLAGQNQDDLLYRMVKCNATIQSRRNWPEKPFTETMLGYEIRSNPAGLEPDETFYRTILYYGIRCELANTETG